MLDRLRQFEGRLGYRTIMDAVIEDISQRVFLPGQKLPPQRHLAHELGVAVATVGRAYAELETQGFINSHIGRGTFVSERQHTLGTPDSATQDVIGLDTYRVPVPSMNDAIRKVLLAIVTDQAPDRILGSAPAAGLPDHRAAMAEWLAKAAGIRVSPDQIVLTNGGQHAAMAALSTITHQGQTIATEALTDPRMKAVASYLDRRLLGIECDAHGPLPDALDHLCRTQDISAVYCTTRNQNPTNITLSLERRIALVEVARKFDLPIIESDIYGTICTDTVPAIFTLAPERTHFISSLGRIAGPGMKVGCLVSPLTEVARTQLGVAMSTGAATLIATEIAARLILSGQIEAMTEWQRAENFRRVALFNAHSLLSAAITSPTSPHVWLTLPEPWRAEDFVETAARHGVLIAPTHTFVVGRQSIPHAVRLVLGAAPSFGHLEIACQKLDALLATQPRPSI